MIVLYHANCRDGFCAAWNIRRGHPDAQFIPVQLYEPVPYEKMAEIAGGSLANTFVLIVDFSYKRQELEQLKRTCFDLIVLDHHKTAQAELLGLDYCTFDMNKSGSRLAQEWCDLDEHWLTRYTEDRDLWLWKLPHSRAVSAALQVTPLDFEVWDKLELADLVTKGYAILEQQNMLIQAILKNKHAISLETSLGDSRELPAVNSPVYQSELGEELGKDALFACVYFFNGEKWIYSLRSREYDVSAVAKAFGGGGHRNAAGFSSSVLLKRFVV